MKAVAAVLIREESVRLEEEEKDRKGERENRGAFAGYYMAH